MGEAKRRGSYTQRVQQAITSKPIYGTLSDSIYILYYDESNNFRKLYLDDKYSHQCYLNSEANPFVLGGLGFKQTIHDIDKIRNQLASLFKKMNKQPTQKEFKFKHVATGDFPSILKSPKLKVFFNWLIENRIFIHIKVLDVIYWSIVDIIESETALKIYCQYIPINIEDGAHALPLLKTLFYEMVQAYKEDFFKELYELGYPNINTENKLDLINFLSSLVDRYRNDQQIYKPLSTVPLLNVFDLVLKAFKDPKSDAFVFLDGEHKHKLIQQMNVYYQARVDSFPKSYHFFDEEEEVIDQLCKHREDKNYVFLPSDSENFIQLSDIAIGFTRVLFDFINKIDFLEIEDFVTNLTSHQKECLGLFITIYDYSIEECEYFMHYVGPFSSKDKFEQLRCLVKK